MRGSVHTRQQEGVVASYLMLAIAPLIVGATHRDFYPVGPVAAVLMLAIYAALVLRRRWAWFVLLILDGAVLISFVFDFTTILAFLDVAAGFALLVSAPMRRYVGI